jgi:hypothetical protein
MADDQKLKRGRKPLAPEDRVKRGRKKKVETLLAERRTQQAPPLNISFVYDPPGEPSACSADATLAEVVKNPMLDVMQPTVVAPPRPPAQTPWNKPSTSMILDESDSDEEMRVRTRPKIDVSQVTSERIIRLLGAHTTAGEWPASTDVCCWNCTEPFEGIPLAVPEKLEKHTKRFKDCTGVFCSFNCMRRWVINTKRHMYWSQLELITFLHKRVVGFTAQIPAATSIYVLKKFGGYMDIDEYRKDFVTLPPTSDMYDTTKRRDTIEILQKNCIPLFRNAFHTHNKHHLTDSVTVDREKGSSGGFDRTNTLKGSQALVNSMNMKVL